MGRIRRLRARNRTPGADETTLANLREALDLARAKGDHDVAGRISRILHDLVSPHSAYLAAPADGQAEDTRTPRRRNRADPPPSARPERAEKLREISDRIGATRYGAEERAAWRAQMRELERTKQVLIRLAEALRRR